MKMTKLQIQALYDEALEKLQEQERELQALRPLLDVIEAQKETIQAQQIVLSRYEGISPQHPSDSAAPNPQNSEDTAPTGASSDLKPKSSVYTVYCDGACIGNGSQNAPGGWGTIVIDPEGKETEFSDGVKGTTNNRMELSAAIAGLSAIPRGAMVKLVSDSQYVINGLQKDWAKGWRRNGWHKSDGKPALNPDLWDQLLQLAEQRQMSYLWVRGHSGHAYNERCDRLAVSAAQRHS